jgi:predicted permease
MTGFWQDFRYSLRTLRNSPGFVVAGILALAFGIGINAMVFTLLNALTLRPLPVQDADALVTVYQNIQGQRRIVNGAPTFFSYAEYAAYRDRTQSLKGIAADASTTVTLNGQEARRLSGQLASCNYFSVLTGGVALGRGFLEEECQVRGASPVVVLSHRLWEQEFDANPGVLGQTMMLNGTRFTIVGVGPRGFSGGRLQAADVWAPITMEGQWAPNRNLFDIANASWLQVIARIKPGTSISQVRADLAVIASQIDQESPGRKTALLIDRATLVNIPQARGMVMTIGAVVLTAVSLVLLIACANLANLLLARAAARQKEIAVRMAVGASRFRLVRQLLTESVIVSFLGGGLGVLAAWRLVSIVYPFVVARIPDGEQVAPLILSPDIRILGFSLALSFATALGFGLLPALQSSRVDLNTALKGGAAGFARSRNWFRSALVSTQVALCLVLLIATGLLARGLYAAQTVDTGFQAKDVTVAGMDLPRQGYDEVRAREFHQKLGERLKALFGSEQVALADPVPLAGARRQNMIRPTGQEAQIPAMNASVSPDFFHLLGIPIVQGRGFDEDDTREGAYTAIISESTARRVWPDENAVGKTFRLDDLPTPYTVAGIARDTQASSLGQTDDVFVYFPGRPDFYRRASLLVREGTGFAAASRIIRSEVRLLDPNVLLRLTRLEDNAAQFQLPAKVAAALGVVLAFAALLLASLGIYGVASYAVARRTREIGIRMSLGADAGHVLRMILWHAMRPVAIGLVFGAAASVAVSSVLSNLLFGVSPVDPVVFVSISVFLAAVAFVASRAPARRAMRINPMAALRSE